MFGIEALNIVIGMIFIYLLFSLFVSIINEIIGNLFNSRGNKLFESIKELIGEEGINDLSKDPRIKVLTQKGSMISSAKADLDELKTLNGLNIYRNHYLQKLLLIWIIQSWEG